MTNEPLRRTSLYDAHRAAGGRLVPFAGWELPVQYVGIADEHRAVRSAAGLFDVSHMGEVVIEGADALASVQRLITNDAGRLAIGQGLYTPMCTQTAGIVDDVTVFRTGETPVLHGHQRGHDFERPSPGFARTRGRRPSDISDETALLALQGPKAEVNPDRGDRSGSLRPAPLPFHRPRASGRCSGHD